MLQVPTEVSIEQRDRLYAHKSSGFIKVPSVTKRLRKRSSAVFLSPDTALCFMNGFQTFTLLSHCEFKAPWNALSKHRCILRRQSRHLPLSLEATWPPVASLMVHVRSRAAARLSLAVNIDRSCWRSSEPRRLLHGCWLRSATWTFQ